MTTRVEKTIVVNVPVSTAYDKWNQFDEFPRFMKGVERVTQLSEDRLEWVEEIAGVRRQWTARILVQEPDTKVGWAAIEGSTRAGVVMFEDAGNGRTRVNLILEYDPTGLREHLGQLFHLVDTRGSDDLDRFKDLIESQTSAVDHASSGS